MNRISCRGLPPNIFTFFIIIGIQPLGRSGQRPEFSQATGMVLLRCIPGKFLGVVCRCFPPLFRCSHFSSPRPPRRERSQRRKWELQARMLFANFAEMTTSTPFRDLLHAANLRHGTDGFTSPPKEGVLRIFSLLKIRRPRSGLKPRIWVLKASTLPLDHRSRLFSVLKRNFGGYKFQEDSEMEITGARWLITRDTDWYQQETQERVPRYDNSVVVWTMWNSKKVKQSRYRPGVAQRVPDFMTTAKDGGNIVSLTHRPPLSPGNTPGTHFCYRLGRLQGHSATERTMSLKNISDTIGNRTCDLPVCSVVP